MSPSSLPRRALLQGGAGAAVAAVFSSLGCGWGSSAQPGDVPVPVLDGQLLLDESSRAQAADDYGHIVHRAPWAVLVPGSVQDIVKMVGFARARRLKIAGARGLGASHATAGQAQVEGGIVVDMSALSTVHALEADSVWVDAGVRWSQLLRATVPQGKSPPTLTDYIELSIGGSLSVGGIGGQAFRSGLQVDNVLELDVVTGVGELVRCSPTERRALFDAVRGGLGQYGLIVRARLRLVAVPGRVRVYTARYPGLANFLADQKRLSDEGRFDYVEGSVATAADGTRSFQLEAVKYFDPARPPDDAALLAGLAFEPGSVHSEDSSYFDFANRLAPLVAFLESQGLWGLPHPWLDMFVPEAGAATFIQEVLADTPAAEIGQDPVLLYAFRPGKLTTPWVCVPPGTHAFLFALLRTANPPTPENVNRLLDKNQRFLARLRELGGKSYLVNSGPRSQAEWREHYGPLWDQVVEAKRLFDPDNVLTPGQGVFPA